MGCSWMAWCTTVAQRNWWPTTRSCSPAHDPSIGNPRLYVTETRWPPQQAIGHPQRPAVFPADLYPSLAPAVKASSINDQRLGEKRVNSWIFSHY